MDCPRDKLADDLAVNTALTRGFATWAAVAHASRQRQMGDEWWRVDDGEELSEELSEGRRSSEQRSREQWSSEQWHGKR